MVLKLGSGDLYVIYSSFVDLKVHIRLYLVRLTLHVQYEAACEEEY